MHMFVYLCVYLCERERSLKCMHICSHLFMLVHVSGLLVCAHVYICHCLALIGNGAGGKNIKQSVVYSLNMVRAKKH